MLHVACTGTIIICTIIMYRYVVLQIAAQSGLLREEGSGRQYILLVQLSVCLCTSTGSVR